MKNIMFIRHAKSSWKIPELSDKFRPLNKRGKANALEIGQKLKQLPYHPDKILCSTATRAMDTCLAVVEPLPFQWLKTDLREELYGCDAHDMIRMFQMLPDQFEKLIVFGHNPEIAHCIELLSGISISHYPTGASCWLQLPVDHWKSLKAGTGKIRWLSSPRTAIEDMIPELELPDIQ
ncbi:histidine phosphatase family protein [Persicobacter sp. CCB-QB2]|uniref:SixA phosphatase family protein n=1 Tax=Persicobacter sp. CCB-QB2 TaxID=1561025 RepID=UPI0006A9724F|nr:histidine phosphatase family protein [Persicobacter sp. CCB-QB2]